MRSRPCQAKYCCGQQVGVEAFEARDLRDDREHERDAERADDRGGAVAGDRREQHADAGDGEQRDQEEGVAANTSSSAFGAETIVSESVRTL